MSDQDKTCHLAFIIIFCLTKVTSCQSTCTKILDVDKKDQAFARSFVVTRLTYSEK
jgi:hypothetical protein